MKYIFAMTLLGATVWLSGCNSNYSGHQVDVLDGITTNAPNGIPQTDMNTKITKTDEEWKKELAASYWDANFLSATETAKFYETQAAELRTILTDIGLIK